MNSSSSGSVSRSARRLLHRRGGLAERIAAKHTVDVDAAQPEDVAHAHLRGDRGQVRLDLVEDRPLALGVQVAQVERELVAVPGIDHDHLRLRVLVEVRAGLVEELPGQRHPLGIDVADDRQDRRVRDALGRAGHEPGRQHALQAGTDRLERDRELAHRRRPAVGPGVWSNTSSIENSTATRPDADEHAPGKLRRSADALRLRDKRPDMPLDPLQISRLRLTHPRSDAFHLHRPRDRRRAEPDRDRPVPLQIRPHPRAFRRRDAQRQRSAVRRHRRPPAACELRPQVIVARSDPHGNAALDELDHVRIEHRRRRRRVHEGEPTGGRQRLQARERPILHLR